MNNFFLKMSLVLTCVLALSMSPAHSQGDEHGHDEKAAGKEAGAHSGEHDDDHGDEHGEDHGDEGKPSANVGAKKGILAANPNDGFQLSPEALKNFGIKLIPYSAGTVKVSKASIFFGLEERNLYRERRGFFKRVDFETISKTKTDYVIKSSDLASGDNIAVEGLGFLRIAELAAFGGVSEGHSH